MVRTKEIARLTTGLARGLYPSKTLNTKAIKGFKCAPSPPHTEDSESVSKEDDVDDICSPTKSGDNTNSTVESLEARIPKLEEHTEPVDNTDLDIAKARIPKLEDHTELVDDTDLDMTEARIPKLEENTEPVDNTDLDMATAVSPAESNEKLSDKDSSQVAINEKSSGDEYKPKIYPKKQWTKKDDDDYLPSINVLKRVFNICPRPKKQLTKKKQVKKKEEKENDPVGLDFSGHGGGQRNVQKKQITKSDTMRRQNCITNDSDSVKRTASLSMAEPVSAWCQPQAKLPSHPIIENFLRGPQERFICKDFKSYADARTFAEKHFQIGSSQNGYSAVGTAGRDPRASINVQKTRCAFEIDTEHRTTVRDEVRDLRRIPNRAKAVIGTSVPPAGIASKPRVVLALPAVTTVS